MPFHHPAVGVQYRGGLPAGLTPPISFGGEPEPTIQPSAAYEFCGPQGRRCDPPPIVAPPVPLALVGGLAWLAAVAVLVFALRK